MSERSLLDTCWRVYAITLTLLGTAMWATREDPRAPPAETLNAAHLRLRQCATGFLGARLRRLDRIVWRALPDSAIAIRARAALPDTIYLHPAWRADEWTVAHEMLHIAIGRPGHPDVPFLVCGLMRPER